MSGPERAAGRPRVRQLDADTVAVEWQGPDGQDGVLVEARCPHRGGLLRHAHVNAAATRLVCPLHHSSFDLTDNGTQTSGPACRALRVRPVPQ
ncbi:Rieske 2Fe-2S domain-containing protein [Streptomyces cinerochromogenes]|uniref:Rieske 2Fe-2S domain-containing protein n=1 Tax=Streptomyces cinerochromogenes TaxID=66422 RepID=UPI0033ADE5A6